MRGTCESTASNTSPWIGVSSCCCCSAMTNLDSEVLEWWESGNIEFYVGWVVCIRLAMNGLIRQTLGGALLLMSFLFIVLIFLFSFFFFGDGKI